LSGNASRKNKRYMLMKERRRLFGDISAKDRTGVVDLVAYAAAKGTVITGSAQYNPGRIIVRKKKKEQ